jgi:dethiobiotin synthetase
MRVVILGTGTDVGKSHLTAALARGLSAHASVLALKPIETGVPEAAVGDAGTIASAANHPAILSPWRYARPVSPHLAAREEGRAIDVSEVGAWVRLEEQRARPAFVLIESAGGALSPLATGRTNVDLALAMGPALWLLVAPDSLGVLHDVTATLRALPRSPDAVVLCGARPADSSSGTNARELGGLGITNVLEVLPAGELACPLTVRWLLDRHT